MSLWYSFKPIPDEEGTETSRYPRCPGRDRFGFKPIPDEEGTETCESRSVAAHPA